MKNVLKVKEFDTITYNKEFQNDSDFQYMEESYFRELEHFIRSYTSETEDSDVLEFMKIGYRRNVGDVISLNNYVGIIELPSGYQVEVLPKISFDDEDENSNKTQHVFLNMLRSLKEFEGKSFNSASLNSKQMNLYDIFIRMYINEARILVKHGLKSDYISQEDNLKYFKGKLLFAEHIRKNTVHKENFYMKYDEYQLNRPENKLIKATLLKLLKETGSAENNREIRQLLTAFEAVESSINYNKDFNKIKLDRNTKDYSLLLQWAKIFLLNKSFTTFSGEKTGKALLFPMEKVFESFIAKWIKKIFEDRGNGSISVSAQDKGYFLFDSPDAKKTNGIFKLRPDIVITINDKDIERKIIMDTKWKCLKNEPGNNYGISQSDMYQMYAYAKKYHTPEIWLLYPLNEDVKGLSDISFKAEKNEEQHVYVNVFFIDLENYIESITELFDRAYARMEVEI